MDLSVVIVSYNAANFLRLTLKSVLAACTNVTAEVFVVDNNSTDGAPEMVAKEFPTCHLIANKTNPGFAIANNQAIHLAKGKYILILNPDTIVAEDTLSSVVSFMNSKNNVGGLGIRMLDGSGNFLPESKRGIPSPWTSFTKMAGLSALFPQSKCFSEYHKGYFKENENNSIEVMAGAFMVLRKNVLNQIGLLDEDFFMYGEDIDLSYRVIKNGFENYYYAESSVIHFKGESTIKDKTYVNRFYKAMIQFADKHFNKTYGFVLKIFIYVGVFLAKVISSIKLNVAKNSPKPLLPKAKLLLLDKQLPSNDLMNRLKSKFEVKIVNSLSDEQSGTIVFVQGAVSYKQMIETMDVYKDRFTYRFLDEASNVMIGSDDKSNKGEAIML